MVAGLEKPGSLQIDVLFPASAASEEQLRQEGQYLLSFCPELTTPHFLRAWPVPGTVLTV